MDEGSTLGKVAIPATKTLDEADLIIEQRLTAHLEAVLSTLNAKLDRVLEVHARLDALVTSAEAIMEEMKNSPMIGALMGGGGGFPGFPGFGG